MNDDDDDDGRARAPLDALRARIDALDHEMLGIMTQRMALVADVAAYKREHGIRIRDGVRERTVLEDRRARAESLGLPVGEIESIFRVLMRSSRDHQAALRVEVPLDEQPRTVAIIGGAGQIGRLFGRLLSEVGHQVLVSDVGTALGPQDAAAAADVVIVSVPIDATEEVIRAVGPHVKRDALLMDVTSIKEMPVRTMLQCTEASVVGTHPMFGPGVHTVQGQRVVLCPARGDAWATWLRRTLEARGLTVTDATPEQHDRAMSIVQVLTHFQTQTLGLTLARLGVPLHETLRFTSPAYLLELFVTARHFAQDARLYGSIEMQNPGTPHVSAAFGEAARNIADMLRAGDQVAFQSMFEEVRTFFGSFTEEAVEQSSFLIDRIVERA